MTKKKTVDERHEAVLLSLKGAKSPMSGADIYAVVQPFFSDRRAFGRVLAGMTKGRLVFVKYNGHGEGFYSLDPENGDDYAKRALSKASAVREAPMICQLYTRGAEAMIAAMKARAAKPSIQNNPDKDR
jgi:hypothetical protein